MTEKASFLLLCVLILQTNIKVFNAQNFARLIDQDCNMDNIQGTPGITKYLTDCKAAISNLRAGIEPTIVARVKNIAVVCCPTGKRISEIKCEEYLQVLVKNPVRPLLPTEELEKVSSTPPKMVNCGSKEVAFIVGGRDAAPGEFPHIAAIGYGPNGSSGYKCGGTLISQNFVISAAHCVSASNRPTVVLLGETKLNVSSNSKSIVKIKNIIVHEDRKNPFKYNDVVLFELEKPVRLSRYVRPACLPQLEDRLENTLNMTTAGWGYTEGFAGVGSNSLQAVNLTRMTQNNCERIFNDKIERNVTYPKGIIRSQFCAGDPLGENGNKDTCNGDSGGPLTVKKGWQGCNHYLIGITSFGSRFCGSGEPGIYTNVISFLDWIEDKVWPGQ